MKRMVEVQFRPQIWENHEVLQSTLNDISCGRWIITSGRLLISIQERCVSLVGNTVTPLAFKKNVLNEVIEHHLHRLSCTKEWFLSRLIPFIAFMAARIPTAFPEGLPILTISSSSSVNSVLLTKFQVLCLLCGGFFGIIPFNQDQRIKEIESHRLQDEEKQPNTLANRRQYNGQQLFIRDFDFISIFMHKIEKVLCLLAYFIRMFYFWEDEMSGMEWNEAYLSHESIFKQIVGFYRRSMGCIKSVEEWSECSKNLQPLEVLHDSLIEDLEGCLQSDFANEYIGGGVLSFGCVQEEIRFLCYPENLVSILFCERMNDNEAIIIVGAERFSNYRGYARTFKFNGIVEHNPQSCAKDEFNRKCTHLCAFDAICLPGNAQYSMTQFLRELTKSYAAFIGDPQGSSCSDQLIPVATGNWGCGAFGGDPQIKALTQWLSASAVGRNVKYCTLGDRSLSLLPEICNEIMLYCKTVSHLFLLLAKVLDSYTLYLNSVEESPFLQVKPFFAFVKEEILYLKKSVAAK